VRPKTAVPRTGWYAVLADPQGNSFAIWQADPTAFPPPEPD
jgi:predicted enzyme related to lactoylglutathione lyase